MKKPTSILNTTSTSTLELLPRYVDSGKPTISDCKSRLKSSPRPPAPNFHCRLCCCSINTASSWLKDWQLSEEPPFRTTSAFHLREVFRRIETSNESPRRSLNQKVSCVFSSHHLSGTWDGAYALTLSHDHTTHLHHVSP